MRDLSTSYQWLHLERQEFRWKEIISRLLTNFFSNNATNLLNFKCLIPVKWAIGLKYNTLVILRAFPAYFSCFFFLSFAFVSLNSQFAVKRKLACGKFREYIHWRKKCMWFINVLNLYDFALFLFINQVINGLQLLEAYLWPLFQAFPYVDLGW